MIVKPKGSSASADVSNSAAADSATTKGVTGSDGSFSVGPLYDDVTYDVTLVKPGHEFQLQGEAVDGKLLFASRKLAQVSLP